MIVDYHMHLRGPGEQIAHHADAVEPFVETARARAVDEIGFTEHVYYFRQTGGLWTLPYQVERCVYDLDAYVDAVVEAKRRGLPVKLGLEVDWWPPHNERLADVLADYPWDYLLGSVHWVDGLAVDQEPGIWEHHRVDDVWQRYFDELCEAALSGHFDVLSHPDLVKVFGHRPAPSVLDGVWRRVAEVLKKADVAAEVSTAGLRKPVGELYPDSRFLAALRESEVPITLASDAHVPEFVGHEIQRAVELARTEGYRTVSVFDGRRRRQEPLG